MDTAIKIEKNVPIAKIIRKRAKSRTKYPYDVMKVGESFFVDNISSRVMCGMVHSYGRYHRKHFAVRTEGTGVRVHRIV